MNIFSVFGKKKNKKPRTGLKIVITYDGRFFSANFQSRYSNGHISYGTKRDVTREVNMFMLNSSGPFSIETCPQWNCG